MREEYRLWFRLSPRFRWRVIGTGTREECEREQTQYRRSGDYYVAHVTVDPNKKVKVT